jgi:hypothetical protein
VTQNTIPKIDSSAIILPKISPKRIEWDTYQSTPKFKKITYQCTCGHLVNFSCSWALESDHAYIDIYGMPNLKLFLHMHILKHL